MREIDTHKCGGLNEALVVEALDAPGHGGACHRYKIWPREIAAAGQENTVEEANRLMQAVCYIQFQDGPIGEADVNGVSNEALLAIVEDRLLGFQSGEFACRENALALTKVQEAMLWLHHRTRQRLARGVEGTSEK